MLSCVIMDKGRFDVVVLLVDVECIGWVMLRLEGFGWGMLSVELLYGLRVVFICGLFVVE